jgi:class 3 adenylate cyclase
VIRHDGLIPIFTVVIPGCAASTAILGFSWIAFFPLFAGSMVALGYALILHYLAVEGGMRPVLIDINREGAPRLTTGAAALSVRVRLLAALPLINIITGLTVAAISSPGGGLTDLGVDVLVAVAVATTISLELSVLLSKSILRPIADLQRATEAARAGRFDQAVPVTTGDELGELAVSFNQMLAGLRERERIRGALGTYLDRDVAEHILSEGFEEGGVEAEVSILFSDIRDFTSFAAQAEAREVVARLNELFEVVVPIIGRRGGHVDKFVGDGVMAVFGAPERFSDHAERAVRAACEIAATVNSAASDDGGRIALRVGVGVNTGVVIAGSIGGGGRLDYSVVGDAVNIAQRVEATTRETGDDVLITEMTMREVGGGIEVQPRGSIRPKGYDRPIPLYAASAPVPEEPGASGVESVSARPTVVTRADGTTIRIPSTES